MKKNFFLSIFGIFIIILSSVFIYSFVNKTKKSLKKYSVSYFSYNALALSQNIVNYINKEYSPNLFDYLLQHKEKRNNLNDYLSSFLTPNNKNLFIVYKDKKGSYRVLADGAKLKNERFDFNEKFSPLKKKIWENLYNTKHYQLYSPNIKDIWMTLLYPYVENGKIKYFIVYDFSISPVKWISNNMEMIKNMLRSFVFVIIVILLILFYYIIRDAKVQLKLENYNKMLQNEVKKKVKELREKDKKMLLQSRMALMGEMLSMIAHQWRQPLNSISSIVGNIQLDIALNGVNEIDINTKLNEINKIIQYLSETIDTFSRFYRKDTKKKKTDINKLIKDTLKIIEPSIEKYKIKLEKDIKCDNEIYIYQNYLKQVLLNIIKNAVDILKEKKLKTPKIIINAKKENSLCIIEIADNAGGIDEKIKDKIFDPYFTTKDEKNGTGLGLYMSKILVENYLNGHLKQYNNKNGAVFRIELKVEDE